MQNWGIKLDRSSLDMVIGTDSRRHSRRVIVFEMEHQRVPHTINASNSKLSSTFLYFFIRMFQFFLVCTGLVQDQNHWMLVLFSP